MLNWLAHRQIKQVKRLSRKIQANRTAMGQELRAIRCTAEREIATPRGILFCFSLGIVVAHLKPESRKPTTSRADIKTEARDSNAAPSSWLGAMIILFHYFDRIVRLSNMLRKTNQGQSGSSTPSRTDYTATSSKASQQR